MIAVLVPAHNEVDCLARCLTSVAIASTQPELGGEAVLVVVAADRCTDGTAALARQHGAHVVTIDAGDVGAARAAAARKALQLGARWLASTDADTVVPADWLSGQLSYGTDAFCGIVTVDDWLDFSPATISAFHGSESPVHGHPHVHGANLGVSAAAYMRCGGFQSAYAHEDVALVARLVATGASIARAPTPRVTTSARRDSRAREGFSDYLKALEARISP